MDTLNSALEVVNEYIWTDWMLYILLATGLLFTLWSGFCQYKALTHGVSVTAGNYDAPDDPGAISHFQALSAALSATSSWGKRHRFLCFTYPCFRIHTSVFCHWSLIRT